MRTFLVFFFLFYARFGFSQETYSLNDLEGLFLQNNYNVLAQKYNIDKAESELIQAKLWQNPTVSLSQVNFWKNNTAFEQAPLIGNYGRYQQFNFDIEQVIETAGKRKKRVDLAKTGKNAVLLEFEELVRNLKLNLRLNYYELYQIQQVKAQLKTLTNYYSDLSTAFEKQVATQNLAKVDLFRVRTALLDAQQQFLDWQNKELEAIQQLRILTQLPQLSLEQLRFSENLPTNLSAKIPANIVDLVKDSALVKQYAQQQLAYSEQLLKLEKANASPNISVLFNYDRNGNYMRDFVGFGIGIDLPIFNRNQGNIGIAKAQIEQQKLNLNQVDLELQTTLEKHIQQLKMYEQILQQFPTSSLNEFQEMLENYSKHLKNKQVSLFEFIDFADAYLQAQSKYFDIEKNYFETFEQIQYLIGKDL